MRLAYEKKERKWFALSSSQISSDVLEEKKTLSKSKHKNASESKQLISYKPTEFVAIGADPQKGVKNGFSHPLRQFQSS